MSMPYLPTLRTLLQKSCLTTDLFEFLFLKLSSKDELAEALFKSLDWSSNEAAIMEKFQEYFHSETKTLTTISTETSLQCKPRPSPIIVPLKRSKGYIVSICVKKAKKGIRKGFLERLRGERRFESDDENKDSEMNGSPENSECGEITQIFQKEDSGSEIFKKYALAFEQEKECNSLDLSGDDEIDDEVIVEDNPVESEKSEEVPVIGRQIL